MTEIFKNDVQINADEVQMGITWLEKNILRIDIEYDVILRENVLRVIYKTGKDENQKLALIDSVL